MKAQRVKIGRVSSADSKSAEAISDATSKLLPMLGPAQLRMLARYERTCKELDRANADARVRSLALAMQSAASHELSPLARQIRNAIQSDGRAERAFHFFIIKGHPEWAQLFRLEEWLDAQGKHHSVSAEEVDLLIPRDRILHELRKAGNRGVPDSDLEKLSRKNWLPHLRAEGIILRRLQLSGAWRTVLESEPKKRKLLNQSDIFREIRDKIELLGNPVPMQEAYRHASVMSRMLRLHETAVQQSPLNDYARAMEDDLARVAGRNLKRMAYLMAVTWRTVRSDCRPTQYLANMFFQRMKQRRRRAFPQK